MPQHLEKLQADQLLALPREKTVFLIPVGPLESHGPHLPIGLDGLEARQGCLELAHRLERELPDWKVVMMPVFFAGLDSNTTRLAFRTRGHVLRDYLIDLCKPLARERFRYFFCLSGHLGPKQLTAIEEAGMLLKRQIRRPRPILASLSSAGIPLKKVLQSPFWSDPEEHGGRRDTSVALHIAPELVAPGYENLPRISRSKSRWKRLWKRLNGKVDGYWGDPQKAQRDEGELSLQQSGEALVPKIRAVLEGADPSRIFRSWYSVFPPNRSFFKAWILAMMLFGVLLIWAFVVFPSQAFGCL